MIDDEATGDSTPVMMDDRPLRISVKPLLDIASDVKRRTTDRRESTETKSCTALIVAPNDEICFRLPGSSDFPSCPRALGYIP